MAFLRLQTYSSSSSSEAVFEQLLVDFEADYSDIFPTPIHLQQFLQKFLDVVWKSFDEEEEGTIQKKFSKMHKFSLLGGDDESLDVQFSVVQVIVDNESNGNSEKEETKIVQAFLPDDAEIMEMHAEYKKQMKESGQGKRMNDGGEFVDEDDDDDDYY